MRLTFIMEKNFCKPEITKGMRVIESVKLRVIHLVQDVKRNDYDSQKNTAG